MVIGKYYQFIRFLIVGIINTIVGLSTIFMLFNLLSINYWSSTLIGNIVGGVCSYFLNKRFTFKSSQPVRRSIFKFIFVNMLAYLLAYSIGYFMIEFSKYAGIGQPSKAIDNLSILLSSGLFTLLNYFGHKYITFRESKMDKR